LLLLLVGQTLKCVGPALPAQHTCAEPFDKHASLPLLDVAAANAANATAATAAIAAAHAAELTLE
jgi:hypothetical protein